MDEDIDNDNMGLEDGHVQALLSAYIDDDLTQAAHEQVRRHIETCPDCRADYIELRVTVQMLHIMPTVPPPRAFTLTEQDIAASAPARAGFFQRLLTPRNAPRFAMGSGLALMLLVFMLAGNLFSSRASLTSIGTVAF